jgi:microcystin-dependent protein
LKNSRKFPRIAGAAALVACMVFTFAALGGVGAASNAVNAAQGQYGKKTTICHKGKVTITVSNKALPAHLKHGDTVGTCAAAKAKKAKAAKIKAAKIKAAKVKAAKAKAAKAKAEAAKTKAAEKSQAPAEGDKPGKGKGRGK